ncbi:MAG: hypothetical protein ACEPOV_06625 [Hyphomicrobiales bacterium]
MYKNKFVIILLLIAIVSCNNQHSITQDKIINSSSWMEEIYKYNPEITLNKIIIPGTTNSSSINIKTESIQTEDAPITIKLQPRNIIKAWSVTQEENITQQLNNGVRFLSFKVDKQEASFFAVNNVFIENIKKSLTEISSFSDKYSKEVVILRLICSKELQYNDFINIKDTVHEVLKEKVIFNPKYYNNIKIGDLWNNNTPIVCFIDSCPETSKYFNHFQYNLCTILDNCSEYSFLQDCDIKSNKINAGYMCVTPKEVEIHNSTFKAPHSLFEMSKNNTKTKYLFKYIFEYTNHKYLPSIFAVDYYSHSDLIEETIAFNYFRSKNGIRI